MSDVERFALCTDGMEPYENGEWVTFDDYKDVCARVAELESREERESMCHAGCGVIVRANTRECLAQVTDGIHPDYMSDSVRACIAAVTREIELRDSLAKRESAEGYALVPRDPPIELLKKMHVAYWGSPTSNHWHENSEQVWRETYYAMLAAAQQVQP